MVLAKTKNVNEVLSTLKSIAKATNTISVCSCCEDSSSYLYFCFELYDSSKIHAVIPDGLVDHSIELDTVEFLEYVQKFTVRLKRMSDRILSNESRRVLQVEQLVNEVKKLNG